MNRTRMLWPATALIAATALAACGSDDPDQSGTDATTPDEATSEEATSEDMTEDMTDESTSTDDMAGHTDGEAMGPGPMVATADSSLGTILVDGEGMTLYLFTQDTPNTSVCFDDCLAAWPILEGEPTAGGEADDSLLGSFEREQSDPATADAMTIVIAFTGRGDARPTADDLAAIEELALAVLRDYNR